MFLQTIILSLLALAFSAPFKPELNEQWKQYKITFNKAYNREEEVARRLIWEHTVSKIIRHNLEADMGMHSYWLGLNHLADMTKNEFVGKMNGYRGKGNSATGSIFLPPFNVEVPDEVDWRKEGLVTEVKNQGHCGSCWAFSATGSLEGQHKKKTGNLVKLSEQNLIDCSAQEGNSKCASGEVDFAFEYVQKNGGIDTEESYPYIARNGTCKFNRATVGATCTGYVDIPTGDENALKIAVATVGPISVAIDANHTSFAYYRSGIFDLPSCSSYHVDHAVLVVGYGTLNGEDYWIVKNSWSKYWGDKGYILMSRNKNNQCGIASIASYPLV